MRVAVTGSTGFIGSALVEFLRGEGHEVVRLVRRLPQRPDEVQWDPAGGSVDLPRLKGVEAAVHLAGAGVGDRRWTEKYRRTIRDSRVLGTRTLVRALGSLDPLPRVLVSGSGIDAYGDGGEQVLTEDSPLGTGFLADVVRDWEAEARAAEDAGIRVVTTRSGMVMSGSGGAFGRRLLPLAKLGLGGPLGDGRQWLSWLTLQDQLAATHFLLQHDVRGPVNLTSPEPARQREVMAAVARAARRPSVLPVPSFVLRAVIGGFADSILSSHRAIPAKLLDAGYTFRHARLEDAARWVTD